jgi:hypothetical protein
MLRTQAGSSSLRIGYSQIQNHNTSALFGHHAGCGKSQAILASATSDNSHFVFEQHAGLLGYIGVYVSGVILVKALHEDKRYKLTGGLISFMLHCNDSVFLKHHDSTAQRIAGL